MELRGHPHGEGEGRSAKFDFILNGSLTTFDERRGVKKGLKSSDFIYGCPKGTQGSSVNLVFVF